MRISIRVAFAAFIISCSAPFLVAAQVPFDVAAARELVLSNSAAFAKATAGLQAALLTLRGQSFDGLPAIGLSASGSLDYGTEAELIEGLGASLRLSASQTLLDGGRQSALYKSAELSVLAARESLKQTQLELVGQADDAFYAVLKAEASVTAALSDQTASELRLTLAQAKAEAGLMARSEYLQAEAEAASYGTALIRARKTLASARARLASLTGLPATTTVVATDSARYDALIERLSSMRDDEVAGFTAGLLSLASSNNPSLASYALASRKASLAIDAARAGYAPVVSAGLSHAMGWDAERGVSLGTGSISLTASMNLDLWVTDNAVSQASLQAVTADVDAKETARVVALEIEMAVNELFGAARAMESSAKALAYAESHYEDALERYRLSSASQAELSAALALVSSGRTAL
ncbi:MAG: TolC family protein, partial [Spirochaetales bacterium]|nr:TolC family protein [Spirochaetales bacterium]